MTHLLAIIGQLHPEALYHRFISLAGELATFTESRKRPPAFPPYRHDDLYGTFRPVMAALRQSLSAVMEQTAVPIPLQERKFGIRVGPDRRPQPGDRRNLGVGGEGADPGRDASAQPAEPDQDRAGGANPRVDQRGAAGHRDSSAACGAATACRIMPGTSYFELDRSSPYWAALARAGGVAIHIAGEIPGLEIECWAIRG